jgi:hypothetical protein
MERNTPQREELGTPLLGQGTNLNNLFKVENA